MEGTHEPVIDRDLWDSVQTLLAQKARAFSVGTIGLFTGKVRCIHCGYNLRSRKQRGLHYLCCPNRYVAQDACPGAFLSVDRLEQAVIAALDQLSAEYLDQDKLEETIEFSCDLQDQRSHLEAELAAYEKKIAEYTKGIRDLYLDKVKGLLSERDFIALSKDFTADQERLTHRVAHVNNQLAVIDTHMADGDNHRERIEQYVHLEHLNREIVDTFIDYILVGKRKKGEPYVPVEIHWNF